MARCWMIFPCILLIASQGSLSAADRELTPAQRGYRNLIERPYLPPDFDQETFDATWQFWPEPLRSQAEKATPDQRRRMAFAHYGLTPRPEDPTRPLQYVVDARGNWTMNCLACHGGLVPDGKGGAVVWPGAPNSLYALQSLTEETRAAKAEIGKPLSRMDLGSAVVPLGTTHGTTNAVMFGVLLMAYRDADLNVDKPVFIPKMTHHDMDAPPWWHFRGKKMIYADGFAEKGPRGLMPFLLVRSNGPEKFRQWEDDFRDIYAYLSSLEPPKYPFPIAPPLAEQGRLAFNRVCAECHGTYSSPLAPRGRGAGGEGATYPERLIPIDEIGTDRVRLDALTPTHRADLTGSWLGEYGKLAHNDDPGGYIAPPLAGIWASAPYFHNGSVPTLWHVLRPAERPVVWKRAGGDFDPSRVGPAIEIFTELPPDAAPGWDKRQYFDTRAFGKSAAGHTFPDKLTESEKGAVLEYLKTL